MVRCLLATAFAGALATLALPAQAVINGSCSGTLTGTPVVDEVLASNFHRCYINMQNAKVNIYGIYLCAAQPDLETYRSACDPIYESTAGTEVTFTYGVDAALPTNGVLSLSIGSYTHMALRIGGSIQNKVLVQFDRNMSGRSGDGQYCYTSGRDYIKADSRIDFSTIDCAATLAAAEAALDWSAEDSGYICSSGGGAKISSKDWEANTFGKLAAKYLVDLDGNEYTTGNGENCPGNGDALGNVAPRFLTMQQLRTPATITPATRGIKISMGFTGYGEVAMRPNAHGFCSGRNNPTFDSSRTYANECVVRLRSKAPEFIVDIY
ncbi:MAG: hypothetical protein VXY13_06850 [Pseudomonadota bacterium]|nr:hypothetical protein [Pseudomonadota bacterium]